MRYKLAKLKEQLRNSKKCVVAFSGGVDSTFLLKTAVEILGENCLAITVSGPLNPKSEIEEAEKTAKEFGTFHKILKVDISEFEWFKNNPSDRCYICKSKVFNLIKIEAEKFGAEYIFDGTNIDDLSDYRPGLKALNEIGIISPLKDAGLTKNEIRALSKEYGIKGYDKPSFTCLATRFPTGSEITKELLEKVEKGEEYLKTEGFRQFRLRCHNELARIEFEKTEISRAFEEKMRERVENNLKKIGFRYIAIDISGYKTGNMN